MNASLVARSTVRLIACPMAGHSMHISMKKASHRMLSSSACAVATAACTVSARACHYSWLSTQA